MNPIRRFFRALDRGLAFYNGSPPLSPDVEPDPPVAKKTDWIVQRIELSSVYFIELNVGRVHNYAGKMLTAVGGQIFFATPEEAQAVIDNGHWRIKVGDVDTDLHWTHVREKKMCQASLDKGQAFRLDKSNPDERYGTIQVSVLSSLHAKVGIVPGRYHDDDNDAWAKAKTILIADLFDQMTALWAELTNVDRMLRISAGYAR